MIIFEYSNPGYYNVSYLYNPFSHKNKVKCIPLLKRGDVGSKVIKLKLNRLGTYVPLFYHINQS